MAQKLRNIIQSAAYPVGRDWLNERYRLLCEESGLITFDYNPDVDCLSCSIGTPKAERQGGRNGRDLRSIVLQPFKEKVACCTAISQESAAVCRDALEAALCDGNSGELEALIDFWGTGPCWNRIKFICITDESGGVCRVVGRADDIGEEKRREAALLEREASLCRVMTANAVLMLEFDLNSGFCVATRNNLLLPGLPQNIPLEDFVRLLLRRVHPQDSAAVLEYLDTSVIRGAVNAPGGRVAFDCRIKGLSGETAFRWVGVNYIGLSEPGAEHPRVLVYALDINEKKAAQLALIRRTRTDPLTGLLNIAAFQAYCQRWYLDTAEQNCGDGLDALVLCEVGGLKQVNDAYGHMAGDQLLRQSADALQAVAKEGDVCARLGGGGFALLLVNVPDEDILRERVRILNMALGRQVDTELSIMASIGICICTVEVGDFQTLYSRADRALSRARELGGGHTVYYVSELERMPRITHQAVDKEMPPELRKQRACIRTFGYFDIFADNRALAFSSAKAKELLALLVDRQGGFVSPREAITCLWEDEPVDQMTLSRYRKIAMRLKNILEAHGIGDIMESMGGVRRIVPDRVSCDLYDYLSGQPQFCHLFKGSYLLNYSWGETTLGELLHTSGQN